MHKSEQSSSDDDGPESPESDSDDAASSGSRRSRPRHLYPHQYAKRMSLLSPKGFASTNGVVDAMDAVNARPQGAARRFFHSAAVWDPALKTVVVRDGGVMDVGEAMTMSVPAVREGRMSVPLRHASEMEEDMDMDAEGEETWREADTSIAVEV